MAITNACVDPARVTADLSESRIAIRQAITTLREVPDETFALLPLNPFVPKRAVKRAADIMFGDLPVSCSNLGEIDPRWAGWTAPTRSTSCCAASTRT